MSLKFNCGDLFLVDSERHIIIFDTTESTNSTSASLVIHGGTSIKKDLRIDGSLYVNGSSVSGDLNSYTTIIGAFQSTGIFTKTISLNPKMDNTSYKIIGNIKSTDNSAWSVSFSNIQISSFDAKLYRLDVLGGGNNDPTLAIFYTIIPHLNS